MALWREALLAQAVLQNRTRGYRNHPQLYRFRTHRNPKAAIATYLLQVAIEAEKRGYHFDRKKIANTSIIKAGSLPLPKGQLAYEVEHLAKKLWVRDRAKHLSLKNVKLPAPHPIFQVVPGEIEDWEKT